MSRIIFYLILLSHFVVVRAENVTITKACDGGDRSFSFSYDPQFPSYNNNSDGWRTEAGSSNYGVIGPSFAEGNFRVIRLFQQLSLSSYNSQTYNVACDFVVYAFCANAWWFVGVYRKSSRCREQCLA